MFLNVVLSRHFRNLFLFSYYYSYETMIKVLDKQKPTIKKDVQAALDKARPNLPVKPLPKSKQQAPLLDEPKAVKSGGI